MKKIFIWTIVFSMMTLIAPQVYGATYNYHYDSNGRLTNIDSTAGRFYYNYDSNGNLVKKEVKDPLGFGVLDSPAVDKIYTNVVTVRGWYLDKAGVESIKVYVNNVLKGLATYGEKREDIFAAYPNFNNHNAGFYYNLELPKENKNYALKVVVRNKKGEETVYTKSFDQIVLLPIGQIESPQENDILSYIDINTRNAMIISGWHLETVRMKKIEVYIDDQLETPLTSSINILRTDINTRYPQYSNDKSGYSIKINVPYGSKNADSFFREFTLKVIIENTNGQKTTYSRSLKVSVLVPSSGPGYKPWDPTEAY